MAFFPDTAFAWVFCGLLCSGLMVAAYTDLRWMIIPKWLTLSILGVGFAMNLIRGATLAVVHEQSVLGGLGQGFLFSFLGFGLAFALFFFMFALGTCYGGDVKIFAAVGAWLGWGLVLLLLATTIVVVCVWTLCRALWRIAKTEKMTKESALDKKDHQPLSKAAKSAQAEAKRMSQRLEYSPGLAIATVLLLVWVFQKDLQVSLPFLPQPTAMKQLQTFLPK